MLLVSPFSLTLTCCFIHIFNLLVQSFIDSTIFQFINFLFNSSIELISFIDLFIALFSQLYFLFSRWLSGPFTFSLVFVSLSHFAHFHVITLCCLCVVLFFPDFFKDSINTNTTILKLYSYHCQFHGIQSIFIS